MDGLAFPSGPGGPLGCMLICMQEKGEIRYLADGCTSCFDQEFIYGYMSMEENGMEKPVKIVFDQIEEVISIEVLEANYFPFLFSLYSVDGRLILSKTITESTKIAFSQNGLYVYNITGREKKWADKLLIKM